MTPLTPTIFKLSICGKFVVEDDGASHPIVWTLAEAGARGKRALEAGAAYEKDADNFTRQGRDVDADIAKSMAAFHLTQAADLLDVLQAADRRIAA